MTLDVREYYHVEPPRDATETERVAYTALNNVLTDISIRLGNMKGTLNEPALTSASAEQL